VTEGEFVGQEFMDRLQIIGGTSVHVGSALMSVNGEPRVGRTVVMEVAHRTNQSHEETTTLFGLDLDALSQLTGSLMSTLIITYGDEEFEHLLEQVAAYVVQLRTADQPDD
jgi:hypothetical protein